MSKQSAPEDIISKLEAQLDADASDYRKTIVKLLGQNEVLENELAATKLILQQENDCAAGIKLCPACEKEAETKFRKSINTATKEWEANRSVR